MAERKKIALCLEYPLALRGGVSVLVETLLEGLRQTYDLLLVSPDKPEELAAHPASRFIASHILWQPAEVSPVTSRQLARQLKERGVHLAHFHHAGNFAWGNRFRGHSPIPHTSRLGIPVVSTVHLVVNVLDGFCGPQKPLFFKLAMLPLAWTGKMSALAHVRHEIAVSYHDAAKLRQWYWPLRGKILQVYHSRLSAHARPQTESPRSPMILNAGHIAWRKGQLVLTEAFVRIASRYPEWKLCMVGASLEEHTADKIRNLARAHGLESRILLPGERSNVFSLMREASVYVQPSYYEALGLALQEALFAGCPAIGTRAGGIPEVIDDGQTGLLVRVGDVGQMASALEKLISNPALRETYGRKAAASIIQKGMVLEQMLARHNQIYQTILL